MGMCGNVWEEGEMSVCAKGEREREREGREGREGKGGEGETYRSML